MKIKASNKRILSLLLAVLMAVTSVVPAFTAFAEETEDDHGVIGLYKIEIFYENNTLVPDYDTNEETGEQTEHIEYMTEGDKVQFNYQIIDCTLPDNGYVKWSSDTPTVCDVTEEGVVRAFDSSKGAAVRLWLDNEVAAIPLVGSTIKSALEKALFNEYVDLDTLDSDGIVAIVEAAFGSDSLLSEYVDTYKGTLIDSLRTYLDKVNTVISCTMYDGSGTAIASDSFKVVVNRSTAVYADFIPNGTHITNKQDLPTTVAKGSELQLQACTTPTRLHMGVIYSVKSSSIFSDGKVVATVDDSGLVKFKNNGTVTILVSPDTEGFIENLLKYINYVYALENTGVLDTEQISDVLINYVGLDMNKNVLKGILDAGLAVSQIVEGTADPVQLSATAVKIIANIILQFTTNDSITFTVVDGVPCTGFDVEGGTTVKEGQQIKLSITNAQPEAADLSDITWYSEDPSIASVDPKTGVITGRDAGEGDDDNPLQKTVYVYAVSAANGATSGANITVTRKAGRYISDLEVTLDNESITIGQDEFAHAKVYPERVASAKNLYVVWGILTGYDDSGNPTYEWAVDPYYEEDDEGNFLYDDEGNLVLNDGSVTDGIGKIDYLGHYYAVAGGECTIVCRAFTGYDVSGTSRVSELIGSDFVTISEKITTVTIPNGKPVESIELEAIGTTSGGELKTSSFELNGETHQYATVKKGALDGYWLNGVVVRANVTPTDATNNDVDWYIDNTDVFELVDQDDDANTVKVRMKANKEYASTVNVYCKSRDRATTSQVLTVSVVKNYVTGNTIDGDNIEITNGSLTNATHTLTFDGSSDGTRSACYAANWYTEDPEVASITSIDEDGNAVIKGNDVGVTTVYCVSADGCYEDSATVTVYPDKNTLAEIIRLCEKTVIKKTAENKADYKNYMRKLSYCYYLLNEEPMAAQDTVDTYSSDLLYAFYKLGGFVDLMGINLLDENGNDAGGNISVKVDTSNYTRTSYELAAGFVPKTGMYKSITWESSDSSVNVDRSGKCTPSANKACSALITVTAEDYVGNVVTDSVYISFAKTLATGVTISPGEVTGGKAGETRQLKATVLPDALIGGADVKGVVWSSSNEGVATVDANGLVTFVYGGDCTITATTIDGGKTATIPVNVVTNYDRLNELISTCEGISLSADNYYPDSYEAYTSTLASAKIMVANNASTQTEVDEMYAALDAAYKGLRKYNFIQKVTLCVEGEAVSDYYQFDLSPFKEGIDYKNAQLPLKILLTPNNGSYATVEWESSNELINVTQAGVVSPNQNKSCYGEIKCTLTDHFGNKYSDTVWVSFAYVPVTSISLAEEAVTGSIGTTQQLNYAIQPDGTSLFHIGSASITDVYWESDDPEIATVDQNGVVTFVNTGQTTVRVITYDGGYTAECSVSTEGDRRALRQAIETYSTVNYMDYTYAYGTAFKTAYDEAVAALTDSTLDQTGIDAATTKLNNRGAALAGHEFVQASTVKLNYQNQLNSISGYSTKSSGSLDDSATAHTYKSTGTLYSSRVILTGYLDSSTSANYKSIEWEIVEKSDNSNISINGTQITIEQNGANTSAKTKLNIIATDYYGRQVVRTIRVVVAKTVVTGITISKTSLTSKANGGNVMLTASVTPSDVKVEEILWYSSDESIATVDANGVVTPHNSGVVVITAESYDGGLTASCTITFTADFTRLASLYSTYKDFYDEKIEQNIYTAASMENLNVMLQQAKSMLDSATANQEDIDTMAANLRAAYNGLVEIVGLSSMSISVPEQTNVSVVSDGYVRYSAMSVNGAQIGLHADVPSEVSGDITYEWSVTGDNLTVDNNGVVTHSAATATCGVVTVYATDELGNMARATINVSFVRVPVTAIKFNDELVFGPPSTSTLIVPELTGSTIGNTSTVYDPSIIDCTFTTADPEIATVDNSGVVTFVSFGETTVTAVAKDGGLAATIRVFTTNDTVALRNLVAQYASVDYMDYEYAYGVAFRDAYEAAQDVIADYSASQYSIDEAATALQTAYNNLDGHPFVGIDSAQILVNGEPFAEGRDYVKDANSQMVITAEVSADAMVKSAELTYDAESLNGVTAEYVDDSIVVTKTTSDASSDITVNYTIVDAYDRTTVITKTIRLVDEVTYINDFNFVYTNENDETIETSESVQYSPRVLSYSSLQLGIVTYPAGAEDYTSITWSGSNSYMSVNSDGLVTMGRASLSISNYTLNVTCTITLTNGTTVTKTIPVTFSR